MSKESILWAEIPEPSCAKKGCLCVDIDILVTSSNGDRKIMQSIRIIIYYRKDFSWPHFNNEARVQEKQQVNDQQSYIFVFVAFPTILSSNLGHQPRHDNSIPYIGIW